MSGRQIEAPRGGERRHISREDWIAEGKSRFGDDPLDWVFKCVACGHEQTGRGMMERCDLTEEEVRGRMYFSCEGRWNPDVDCDWSLGGLLQIHTLEVVADDGELLPVFEFAEGGAS